jgi:hypothetical protein
MVPASKKAKPQQIVVVHSMYTTSCSRSENRPQKKRSKTNENVKKRKKTTKIEAIPLRIDAILQENATNIYGKHSFPSSSHAMACLSTRLPRIDGENDIVQGCGRSPR